MALLKNLLDSVSISVATFMGMIILTLTLQSRLVSDSFLSSNGFIVLTGFILIELTKSRA